MAPPHRHASFTPLHRVAVGPRSPDRYTDREGSSLPTSVAVGPRSPDRYTPHNVVDRSDGVAVGPRSPDRYTPHNVVDRSDGVAVGPRSPDRYTVQVALVALEPVAVGPRSPDRYTPTTGHRQPPTVAVGPRSPDRYTAFPLKALISGPFLWQRSERNSVGWSKHHQLIGVSEALFTISSPKGLNVLVLFVGNLDHMHSTLLRYGVFDSPRQRAGLLLAGAVAQVDRILAHLKPVIEQMIPEARGCASLDLGANRQIKQDNQPHDAISAGCRPVWGGPFHGHLNAPMVAATGASPACHVRRRKRARAIASSVRCRS